MGTSPSVARATRLALRGRLAAFLLLSVVAAGCQRHPADPLVLLIAAEGLDPHLLERLLAHDELPNIQRLVDRGSLARVRSDPPGIAPVVWTTVATGLPAEAHGIDGFVVDGLPARSTQRRAPAFWNLLVKLGESTAIVGWPVTWPAEPESGIVVSDRAHLERSARIEPEGLLQLDSRRVRPRATSGLDRFTSLSFDPEYVKLDPRHPAFRLQYLVDHRLNRPLQRDRIYVEIALELLGSRDLGLLALGLEGIDSVSHGFWGFLPADLSGDSAAAGVSEPDVRLGQVIPAYYRYLDHTIAQLLRAARREPLVILLSDHGFESAAGHGSGRFVSGAHREGGALLISGPGAQRGVLQTRPIKPEDILPTLLWITGHPQAEDLPGRPLREYLTSRFDASASIPTVPSYRDPLGATRLSTPRSIADSTVIEDVESLGYLEP